MTDTREIVNAAYNDNAVGLRDTMNTILQDKIAAALSDKKIDMAKGLVTNGYPENVDEEVDDEEESEDPEGDPEKINEERRTFKQRRYEKRWKPGRRKQEFGEASINEDIRSPTDKEYDHASDYVKSLGHHLHSIGVHKKTGKINILYGTKDAKKTYATTIPGLNENLNEADDDSDKADKELKKSKGKKPTSNPGAYDRWKEKKATAENDDWWGDKGHKKNTDKPHARKVEGERYGGSKQKDDDNDKDD